MSCDFIIQNATLVDGRENISVVVQGERITEVFAGPAYHYSGQMIDAQGQLLSAPFVDAHFHLDSVLTAGQPRVNASGTLLEGIQIWSELKPTLTLENYYERAKQYCQWALAQGLLAIRSHVDISDPQLLAVEALVQLKKDWKHLIDLQLVAFPQDGLLRHPKDKRIYKKQLISALDKGVDVVGGIPHFERTAQEGAESIQWLCELAATRGLLVDMHCDENDDPWSRQVETLAFETQRLGLEGRVTGSHLTSMHSMDNYYVSKLIPLLVESKLQVVANPLINIAIQGRHDTYPKRRGMTRVKELMSAGVNVGFGQDCVKDPWYHGGSGDMLEVAHMGLHVGQMTSMQEISACYQAVTSNAAKILQLQGYGIVAGNNADLVLLQAKSSAEAIRLRSNRLKVWRRGRLIAQTPAKSSEIFCLSSTYPTQIVDFSA